MKEGQKKIYYLSGTSVQESMANPFMEPFKDSDVPVLLIGNQVDEMVFQQIGTFKGYTFVNVESGYEEVSKDLGDKNIHEDFKGAQIPEDDITPFCLWIKDQTKPFVGKVTLSKRLKSVPCVLFGQVSANMRVMMNMMQQQSDNPAEAASQLEAMSHNQTLELNPTHPIIVKLNKLRKTDQERANRVSQQMLDNVLMASAIPHDVQVSSKRNLEIIDDFLQMKANKIPLE